MVSQWYISSIVQLDYSLGTKSAYAGNVPHKLKKQQQLFAYVLGVKAIFVGVTFLN